MLEKEIFVSKNEIYARTGKNRAVLDGISR
jgi:hypothetical protein